MNVTDIAALPLATIIVAAILFIIFQTVTWAQKRYRAEQVRLGYARKIDAHISFNHGVFLRALLDVLNQYYWTLSDLKEINSEESRESQKPDKKTEPSGLQGLASLLFPSRPSSAPVKDVSQSQNDNTGWIVTEGYLNLNDVAEHMDKLGKRRSGLALFFIESLDLIRASIPLLDKIEDEPDEVEKLLKMRKTVATSLAEAVLVSSAYLDKEVREKVTDILKQRGIEDTVETRATALHNLLIARFPAIGSAIENINELFEVDENDQTKAIGLSPALPEGIDPEEYQIKGLPFASESFRVIDLPRRWGFSLLGYLVPALFILAFAATLYFVQPIRDFLFAKEPAVSCTTQVTMNGGAPILSCGHSAATLSDAVSEGMGLNTGPVAPSPTQRIDCKTEYDGEGSVIGHTCTQSVPQTNFGLDSGLFNVSP